jgi:ring-1,2-phenylacetyl-CoA epoxidase subunit PaaE
MSQYHQLKVKEIIKETSDAITIVFENGAQPISYKSGQFLTLIVPVKGEKLRRSYSLCSSPYADKELAVTVKRVAGGVVSNYLPDALKAGDTLEVMEPTGTFHFIPDFAKRGDIVLIGAGSGITPLISIAKSALLKQPGSKVYLIYGNRNETSVIFKQKIELLQSVYKERCKVVHRLSQPKDPSLPAGRLNRSEIIKLLEGFKDLKIEKAEYYLCGPDGLMQEAIGALELLKVNKSQIKKESFLPSDINALPAGKVVADSPSTTQDVTIIYQGTEYKITVPPNKSILEVALKENIDLPYSCQSGMCTACMGKCISGKVHLDESDALSDKELESGYVLTCVGHPVTPNVVIEID